ncbi:MAG: hypothetical protein P4M11_04615 [Candidatus Pacebacteria bacterium]|nr:hypothetical protein [Candidatus Paceibacterota bacterium]
MTRDVSSILTLFTFCKEDKDFGVGSSCSYVMMGCLNSIGWITALACSFFLVSLSGLRNSSCTTERRRC